jgi:N-methylhydantoinase A
MATRIGVDVGGTFTDLIVYDDRTGDVRVVKEPTTPEAPEEGVLAAVGRGIPEDVVAAARYFLHGTTVGLNALLERRGAVVGLLATRGFRDVLEVRRGDRAVWNDLFWRQPPPLVPRRLRLPVTERILADGAVHVALDPDDVRRAAGVFADEGVTAVAIAFMNAYANPEHELLAARVLRDAGFGGELSLSHRVSGEYREYERTSTTVVDAFVRPRVARYLSRLEERLRGLGFGGTALVTRSGGGAMTFEQAERRPFETILSGPVAGAEGAAELARELELPEVIAADVGGTSFDTCLVADGRPTVLYQGEVVGLPVQSPWVDVRSIGAGGGSVAWVDVGGLLRVGPRSAGAVPGPASYGRGGTEPTVTDAALVLGLLPEGELAGGVRLDRELALAALTPLAGRLDLADGEAVARGVLTIAAAAMANAIREITVERGRDPRAATLLAFGGAGPVFATLLARELGVAAIVVPPYAGNFSAWGLLGADLTRTAARTRIARLSPPALDETAALAEHLFAELASDGARRETLLDLRYLGQEHSLTVAVPAGAGADELRGLFAREYERTFGHSMEEEVEIVAVRAAATVPLPRRAHTRPGPLVPRRSSPLARAWSFARGEQLEFAVVDRAALAPGGELAGPAIVLEETATTYLDAGFTARVHEAGSLLIGSDA